MDFAVRLLNEKADAKGKWVLAVEGDRLLIGGDENRLRWVDMSECVVTHVANPEMPRPVIPVQPPQPAISRPAMNIKNLVKA